MSANLSNNSGEAIERSNVAQPKITVVKKTKVARLQALQAKVVAQETKAEAALQAALKANQALTTAEQAPKEGGKGAEKALARAKKTAEAKEKAAAKAAVALAAAKAAVAKEAAKAAKSIIFYFNSNSNEIINSNDEAEIITRNDEAISAITEFLKQNAGYELLIEGFCDTNGSDEHNERLGTARAESVKRFLQELWKIDESQMILETKGEQSPVFDKDQNENMERSRRVELTLRKRG